MFFNTSNITPPVPPQKNLSHQNRFHIFNQNIREVNVFSECFVQLSHHGFFSFILSIYLVQHKIDHNHLLFNDLFLAFYYNLKIALFFLPPKGTAIISNVILLCLGPIILPEYSFNFKYISVEKSIY